MISVLFHWEIADNELILSSLFNLLMPCQVGEGRATAQIKY
jgi:hypothetical protein